MGGGREGPPDWEPVGEAAGVTEPEGEGSAMGVLVGLVELVDAVALKVASSFVLVGADSTTL